MYLRGRLRDWLGLLRYRLGLSIYRDIDPTLDRWVKTRKVTLWRRFFGEARFLYVTGGVKECFHVSIEPQKNGDYLVHLWFIETIDDADLHREWTASAKHIEAALDAAMAEAEIWKMRVKGPATW